MHGNKRLASAAGKRYWWNAIFTSFLAACWTFWYATFRIYMSDL